MNDRVMRGDPGDVASATARMVADLETGEIETVVIGASDAAGVFRGKRLPAAELAHDPGHRTHFADLIFALDIADGILEPPADFSGWWPNWGAGFGDIDGVVDPTTYRRVPWLDRTAIALIDLSAQDGTLLAQAPRGLLRRVLERVPAGLTPMMAPELEFTLFKGTSDELAARGYRDLEPIGATSTAYGVMRAAIDEHVIRPLRDALAGIGIAPEASCAEAGIGQYELNMSPRPALQAADDAFLFKQTVREVAESLGYTASFMARPLIESFGSSLHVHQSLWRDGANAFADADDPDGLSTLARQFVAGQLATMREFTAIFAPTVNSYKRLTPESAAGTTVTWALQSKTVGIRVCAESARSTRVEHRTPGADANPYLVLAAALAGGLWGIENELAPPPPTVGNAYADATVAVVPGSLAEAADVFEQSEAANRYFGEEIVRYLAATRRIEAAQYAAAVTDWEISRYLGRV